MNLNIENAVYILAGISLAIIFWIIHKMDQAVKK